MGSLPVGNDLFLLVSGLVETIEDLLVAWRILRYIGIPRVDFIFREIFRWIYSRGISQFWSLTRQNLNKRVSYLEKSSLLLVATFIDVS
jgi:hypothetical protein